LVNAVERQFANPHTHDGDTRLFPFLHNARMLNPLMGQRRLASEARAAQRGGGKSPRKPLALRALR
jgi:hypothetical protein